MLCEVVMAGGLGALLIHRLPRSWALVSRLSSGCHARGALPRGCSAHKTPGFVGEATAVAPRAVGHVANQQLFEAAHVPGATSSLECLYKVGVSDGIGGGALSRGEMGARPANILTHADLGVIEERGNLLV